MVRRTGLALRELYTADETAWLEAMADLIAAGTYTDLDYENLGEYLADMAKRDRREVESRLAVLLTHVLKWLNQPEKRTGSWKATILTQQHDFAGLAERGVLRNHADAVIAAEYRHAVLRAAAETGLPAETFPAACPYTVDELLAFDPAA